LLEKFKTLVAVVQLRSFSRAAGILNLSQPAVSKQIASLQSQYGMQLFQQPVRQCVLTPAGEVLFRHALSVLEAYRNLQEAMGAIEHATPRTLMVGASTVPGQYILPLLVGPFMSRHPNVLVNITIHDTREVGSRLLHGEVDLALTGIPLNLPGVATHALFDDELVLIAPLCHALSTREQVCLQDIEGEVFIWREQGSATRQVLEDALGSAVSRLRRTLELGNTQAVVAAVEAGAGLAFVSRWAANRAKRAATLAVLPLDGLRVRRKIYGSYLGFSASGTLEEFLNFLLEAGARLDPDQETGQ
jgi:DNA-binding transcriptional LysR family regulator